MEQNITHKSSFSLAQLCWDAWCCLSIVGIWPRFIEHRLLSKTHLTLSLPHLPRELSGLKIAQFSDLHLHPKVSNQFLQKIQNAVTAFQPDIILFTGDFLCFSLNRDFERLKEFFKSFKAPYGCYCILGNHDYAEFVSVNEKGDYDILNSSTASFSRIFKRLWTHTTLSGQRTERVKKVTYHEALEALLKETSFKLLKNESIQIPIKHTFLNLTGLEEYSAGRADPQKAFVNYDSKYPGIVMAHNPDTVPSLLKFPGEIILCGHTHGGQVNLPWLWKKFTLMENPQLKKGLVTMQNKNIYVNRGVGSVMQFRWFSTPELLLLTLEP